MSRPLRVVPDDLQVSASVVDAHADAVHARHLAADGRIEAAQAGLPAASATALAAAVTRWQATTTALFARMVDHSQGLRAATLAYQSTDTDSGEAIESAADRITDLDLGL